MMKTFRILILALLPLGAPLATAGDLTTNAAIGGALGGAIGGALGAEIGGREGAVIGAGVGAAAGSALSTRHHADLKNGTHDYRYGRYEERRWERNRPRGHFCPPGQAKKGRC